MENKKKRKKKKSFVPIHETTKKASKKREESLNRALESIQESLKNGSTDELVKEDSERQEQRDESFFTFTERMLTTPVTKTQPTSFTFESVSD